MQGPCMKLQSAGARGKHSSNVQRDIMRKVDHADPDQAWASGKTCVKLMINHQSVYGHRSLIASPY